MGISHEYHSTSHRARHGGVSGKLRLAGVVLAILVLAYAITAIPIIVTTTAAGENARATTIDPQSASINAPGLPFDAA